MGNRKLTKMLAYGGCKLALQALSREGSAGRPVKEETYCGLVVTR